MKIRTPLTEDSWNTLYSRELSNHASNPSDIGTVWFDDSDAELKMIRFINDAYDDGPGDLPQLDRETTSFLDLGCGNGSMLFGLREEEWTGRALGVDYSPQSVALAKQVAISKAEDDAAAATLEFAEWDIIGGAYRDVLSGEQSHGWDVVLDKGTFDAISLSDQRDEQGRRLCELYPGRIVPLVRKGGIFLVTSCNWTEEELTNWFVTKDTAEGGLVIAGRVEYRTFSFGGVKGQTISTLCFRRP
jgi:SAM-dependent methyltransferase